MVNSVSFQTRARTIDHLGREQIADCPTAISELWKNAHDAYAWHVSLNIFDGEVPTATLVDDGHGMTLFDVQDKWLTVGTDSKVTNENPSIEDLNGHSKIRIKQGQKGIGRLSCAALGSLMLMITKRKSSNFVACLLDWRLFENPYLMLQDIKFPITEFETKNDFLKELPKMFDSLLSNLHGDGVDELRDSRILAAWNSFNELELLEGKVTTKSEIEKTAIKTIFTEQHLNTWPVWSGKHPCGTAMLVSDIHEDLIAQLSADTNSEGDGAEIRAKESFNQTLNSFTNNLARDEGERIEGFATSVVAWNRGLQRLVIDEVREFDLNDFDNLEHIIDGKVDDSGQFTGSIKAFGDWHHNIVIKPKARYKTRKDTYFGCFKVRLGTFEVLPKNTTLSAELHTKFDAVRERFGGVMVFRDNLRVMPYGREDNDFFEIEKRRTNNAGRYVFSNRACFGGVFITKAHNPNLRDKAGREGIIDNKASKLFREVVENILIQVAKRFIGRDSEIRPQKLEEINAQYAAEKAAQDRKKLLRKERNRVKKAIIKNYPEIKLALGDLEELTNYFLHKCDQSSQDELTRLRHEINEFDIRVKSFSLSPVPKTLGSIESEYREYREKENLLKANYNELSQTVNVIIENLQEKEDIEIAEANFNSKAGVLHQKIRKLATNGRVLLKEELNRFEEQIVLANKAFHKKMAVHLDDLAAKRTNLKHVNQLIEDEYQIHDLEISQNLGAYISALGTLKEQIDLEGLAIHSVNETNRLQKQNDQLHALAQLGISIEIIGHEIENQDLAIERGLSALVSSSLNEKQSNLLQSVQQAHQSLSDSWRFLSPLKLAGEKIKARLTGDDIYHYVSEFFKKRLDKNEISFNQTDSFKNFKIYEEPAKLYPVFINLVNNARYWVKESEESERKILLDFKDGLVIVADNGPGVDVDDIDELFTLFFSKKQRGGRGVGLYLCRRNLATSGHRIYYQTEKERKALPGANFVIEFKGIKHG